MSAGNSSAGLPKKSRNWHLITIVVVILLTLVGFIAYVAYQQSQCFFGSCKTMDEPVILNAQVITSSRPYNCAVVTESSLVVCQILASGGDSGTVVMNLTSQGGDSWVAFGTYSSESQYIHYNSTYSCLYSSNSPDWNTARCPVYGAGSTYRFDFTVAQTLPPQQQVILTITVLKTCCWP